MKAYYLITILFRKIKSKRKLSKTFLQIVKFNKWFTSIIIFITKTPIVILQFKLQYVKSIWRDILTKQIFVFFADTYTFPTRKSVCYVPRTKTKNDTKIPFPQSINCNTKTKDIKTKNC